MHWYVDAAIGPKCRPHIVDFRARSHLAAYDLRRRQYQAIAERAAPERHDCREVLAANEIDHRQNRSQRSDGAEEEPDEYGGVQFHQRMIL